MVQMQPHLTLTLEALGSSGVVLPLEQKVRLLVLSDVVCILLAACERSQRQMDAK